MTKPSSRYDPRNFFMPAISGPLEVRFIDVDKEGLHTLGVRAADGSSLGFLAQYDGGEKITDANRPPGVGEQKRFFQRWIVYINTPPGFIAGMTLDREEFKKLTTEALRAFGSDYDPELYELQQVTFEGQGA